MKLSFNVKNYFSKAKSNISLLLWPILGLLLLLEVLVIRQSLGILASAKRIDGPPSTQSVRVNFGLQRTIEERLQNNADFAPAPVTVRNPFGPMKQAGER
jgi:hypothetical protein